jgi:predicted metal-dependent peptidase
VSYNPEFVMSLSQEQLIAVLAHEGLHPGFAHHARKQDREHFDWNVAADLEINPILTEAGYKLPKDCLMPGNDPYKNLPSGLVAEDYYSRVWKKRPEGGSGPGSDPGKCGGVLPAGDEAQQKQSAADWKVTMAQAAAAGKEWGTLPGSLARLVDQVLNPEVPWQEVLEDFIQRSFRGMDDYTWQRPNRRYIAQDLYLPGTIGTEIGELVIAIDTSGSISNDILSKFTSEIRGILECNPCKVTVLTCDAAIHEVTEWNPGEGDLVVDTKGGGGTSHVPIWEWLDQQQCLPVAVICLTDGYTDWGKDPEIPVMWALITDIIPPFGRRITIK